MSNSIILWSRALNKKSKSYHLATIFAAITINLFAWVLMFRVSFRGLDFSDEGKYLLDSFAPSAGTFNITHYGYVYSALFRLLDFNIPLFRLANLVITYLLSILTTYLTLRNIVKVRKIDSLEIFLISTALGLISISFFLPILLITPSYNSLTFQSLLLCSAFIVGFISKKSDSIFNKYSFLLGGSFCLLFLAKPTSFILLLAIFLILTITERGISVASILVFLSALSFLLCFSSLLIYGNLLELFFSVKNGSYAALGLTDSYGFVSQINLLKIPNSLNWVVLSTLLLILILFCLSRKASHNLGRIVLALFILLLPIYLANMNAVNLILGNYYLLFCSIIILFFSFHDGNLGYKSQTPRFILVFVLLPFIGAFGTNNNLWIQASMFFYFFLFSGFLFWFMRSDYSVFRSKAAVTLFTTILLTFGLLSTSIDNPYRQLASLRENNSLLVGNDRIEGLKVSKEVFLSITSMYVALEESDFQLGTPVIDFTGQSPTTLFLAGAFPLGDTWLLGGYKGSNENALKKLSQVDCNSLSKAWLLIEEGGPRALNHSKLISKLGLNFTDYLAVAKWDTPRGAGGYSDVRSQVLFKPSNPLLSCR